MAEAVNVKNIGLRGVTVADTKVSFIDGEKGVLIYRGYRIEDLAEKSTFMKVAYLLLQGVLPDKVQLESFERDVLSSRRIPEFVYESLKLYPKDAKPMDILQASVPLLATADPDLQDDSRDANLRKAIRLISRLPVITAAWHAHIIEEKFGEAQEKPALYRPKAEYVGQYCGLMGCTYEET